MGTAILGLSKIVMYNFHYNYIMENFPGAKLLFTDTFATGYLPTKIFIRKLKGMSGLIFQITKKNMRILMMGRN